MVQFQPLIARTQHLDELFRLLARYPVVAILGARMGSRLWLRGGFPRSFLCRTDVQSMQWRVSFLRTFLERDLPMLGVNVSADSDTFALAKNVRALSWQRIVADIRPLS